MGSENMAAGRPGHRPTPLPPPYAGVPLDYATQVGRADLTAQARRSYLSRVRMFLAWLAGANVDGDPLTDPAAAVWAARDCKAYLYGTGKRAPATVNAALAAVSDLAIRRGLGKLDGQAVARLDLPPRRAPKALTGREDIRWQRAAQTAAPRDRALAAVMRLAGARIAETVALDLDDLPATQRRRRLRIRGKGRKHRAVPVHPELAAALDAWLAARRSWPGGCRSAPTMRSSPASPEPPASRTPSPHTCCATACSWCTRASTGTSACSRPATAPATATPTAGQRRSPFPGPAAATGRLWRR